jgi:hypothetical protein
MCPCQHRPWATCLPVPFLLVAAAACSAPRGAATVTPAALRTPPVLRGAAPSSSLPGDLVSVAEWDAVPVIEAPARVSAGQADRVYAAGDRVIGVSLNGESLAYSVAELSQRQAVNDTLGGTPIVVAWSSLAYAATVFLRPDVDGRTLDFGSSGKLVRNVSALYDRQSASLWNSMTGQAVLGALQGWRLEAVPAAFTTWAAWRRARPETEAMARAHGGADPSSDYYASDAVGRVGAYLADERLAAKSVVLGTVAAGRAVCWPLDALDSAWVRNDVVGGVALLVIYDPESATALIYDRMLGDGRRLSFHPAPGAPMGLLDRETGSRWDGWTGAAVDGPLAGTALAPLPSTPAFWFAWHDHYPATAILGTEPAGTR